MATTEKQINEIETYFIRTKLPAPVQLYSGTTIENIPKFIESHISVLRHNGDKNMYDVFYDRRESAATQYCRNSFKKNRII